MIGEKLTSSLEVFWRFLLLGLTSFGGPAAHIGYFRRAFVEDRQWLDEAHFGRLVALSQFLPGPGSSQLGFAIGLHRAGLPGALAAFLGFTLPSFVLMLGLALIGVAGSYEWTDGVIQGLKLLAVVVVADACISMYGSFCTSKAKSAIAAVTAALLIVASGIGVQIMILISAAIIGMFLPTESERTTGSLQRPSVLPLVLFFGIAILLVFPLDSSMVEIARDFYVTGSLVFGGGHVVLPLLETLVADDLSKDTFLTGYAAAQAVPGPMFTLAAYLGAELGGTSPFLGALIATMAIFLPGFLLLLAFHDAWHGLMQHEKVSGAASAINAAVVGLLIAALYDPVFTSAVSKPIDMAIIVLGLFLIRVVKINLALLVSLSVAAGLFTFSL